VFSFVNSATYTIGTADGVSNCKVSVSPSSVEAGKNVTISITPSTWLAGASDRTIKLEITPPGSSKRTQTLTSQSYSFSPDKIGTYQFKAILGWKNWLGWAKSTSTSFTLSVTGNMPPTANFVYKNTAPGYGTDLGTSKLNASLSSDPDGTIKEYTWNFDAGNPITGYKTFYNTAIYIFNWSYDTGADGIFEAQIPITLTVKDNDGATDSITKNVNVRKVCITCITECTNPKDCGQMGWECGSGKESNCQDNINCGNCPSGKTCQNHKCVPVCNPYSCSQMGWECGSGYESKCNSNINCGNCNSNETCINHSCEPSCNPKSCSGMNWECGSGYESKCSSYINCDGCGPNETCINHSCEPSCNPKNCSQMNWECGTGYESNCSSYLSCGWCANNESCIGHKCVPDCDTKNCSEMNWECGDGYETCGNWIECNDCETNEACDNHKCVPTCTEKSCSEMNWECGYGFENGCGNFIPCGNCGTGEKCENNQCVPDCIPKDCDEMGWECGYGTETGCGNYLPCENCASANDLCIGNQCICQPETCATLGKECGTITEPNCSGTLDCGTCPAGEMCSPTNHCVCEPKTCAEMGWGCETGNEDRCGQIIDCGPCAGGSLCQNNTCCTPQTCIGLGWECGLDIEPNCGQALNCGLCPNPAQLCINHGCNAPPEAKFKASTLQGLSPLVVGFDATESTDIDGDPLFFEWDFGDGTTGSNATETKIFTANGIFIVILTVTDNHGLFDTAQKTVRTSDKVGITGFSATHPKNKNENTTVKISCSKDGVSAKIEFQTMDGASITPPLSTGNTEILINTCGITPTEIIRTDFPNQGVYQVTATITGQNCENCPQTRYFVVGRDLDNLQAPETSPIVVLLTALGAISIIALNGKKKWPEND